MGRSASTSVSLNPHHFRPDLEPYSSGILRRTANRIGEVTMADREQSIRDRAYSVWQPEGQLEGKHREQSQRASSEIDAEDDQNDGAGLSKDTEMPLASVGSASGLQPSGTSPGP